MVTRYRKALRVLNAALLLPAVLVACGPTDTEGCPSPEVLDSAVQGTLSVRQEGCPDYEVVGALAVDGDLTIEAGVIMRFAEGASLSVPDGSALTAEGTASAPILLTGTDEHPGWWDGVVLASNRHANDLDHVIIEYARTGFSLAGSGGTSEATAGITNSTFRHNAEVGLRINRAGHLTAFGGNRFESNGAFGVSLEARRVESLSSPADFEDNAAGAIEVSDGQIEADVVFRDAGGPYTITDSLTVESEATLTLEEGVHLRFDDDTRLGVRTGRLRAQGTETDPILLEGTEAVAGWWRGIYIRESADAGPSQLEHVHLRHAGSSAPGDFGADHIEPAGISIGHASYTSSAVIRSCVIEAVSNLLGDAYGIYVGRQTTINEDVCEANAFDDVDGVDCFVWE